MQALISERHQADAVRMLKACGVDPRNVPLATSFERDGQEVTLSRYLRDASGDFILAEDGYPKEEEFTIRPPADVIPSWLP